MNKSKGSTKIRNVRRENSKINNEQEVSVRTSMKVDVRNDSPQRSYDSRVSGHSTPIQKRDYVYDVEDSPELDYRCSPISMPCTQDGGNEIAWDWQTSVNKVHDKTKQSNNHIETPKRTRQLQKKRNSNSPLLQKPFKRKQVKMENIENIGKLTAELKALSEKMKNIQQNSNNDTVEDENDLKVESKNKLLIESDSESSDDIIVDCVINRDTRQINSSAVHSNNKKVTNYEELFDDSIDDSMVRCSQEIEEKLNLCKSKMNDTMQLSTVNEKKESFSISEKEFHHLTTSNTSTECSKSSSISKTSSTNTSGYVKTYSNNSNKVNSTLNVSMSNSKLINNNAINVTHGNQILKDKSMADFPDDSFDDCLATCIDDKVLSKLSEYDFNPSNSGHNTENLKKVPKQNTSNTVANKMTTNNFLSKLIAHSKRELITDDLVEEVTIISNKKTIQNAFPSKNSLENRKFFKTKSLSDHCVYQTKNANINNKTTNASKSEKRLQSNLVTPSVSTTFPIINGQNPHKNNNRPSINGVENVNKLNRLDEKEGGNCIVKYKSTSNLSNIKEVKESQSTQCTPEEIERKRLEAKMKLEAKRKLQQTNTRMTGILSETSVNKCVKR